MDIISKPFQQLIDTIAKPRLWQWCCFIILLPVLGFGQDTKDFKFYNQINAEILENYY